jgi:integrase
MEKKKKRKNKKQPGVFAVKGKRGLSYGIDYIHPATGQRVRKILKNVTSEARAAELRAIEIGDAARGAIDKAYGLKAKARAVSFCTMVEEYLKWSEENKKSAATDDHRAKPLKKAFKGRLMSDMNPFVVEKYKMARAKQVTKATVNKELIFGSQVFRKAAEWGKYVGENPFFKTKFKLEKRKKPGCLTPEQVQAIKDQIPHPVKRDMVAFAFAMGWRISEIRKLKWADVDLDKGRAWIVDPKNGESVEVPLSDEAKAIVARQGGRGDFVFCKLNGDRWTTNMNKTIRAAADRAGVILPLRKGWHILRRTWASMFLQNGGDVESLRVQGHWKDYSMPMWYADAADESKRKTILNRIPKLDEGRNLAEISNVVQLKTRSH